MAFILVAMVVSSVGEITLSLLCRCDRNLVGCWQALSEICGNACIRDLQESLSVGTKSAPIGVGATIPFRANADSLASGANADGYTKPATLGSTSASVMTIPPYEWPTNKVLCRFLRLWFRSSVCRGREAGLP